MKKQFGIVFALLLGLGVFLRLWMLGLSAFGADVFYGLALKNPSIIELWKNPPWLNQIPLNETLCLFPIWAGLPLTSFVVRFPFALMGILALFFVWQFARKRAGASATALVLLLAVLNPYQLYFSRTAYHYSGALCWSAALFCVFWSLKEKVEVGAAPKLRSIVLWFAVAALACHMHMSVWAVAGLQGILLLWFGWRGLREDSPARKKFLITTLIGAGLLGLLLSRWALRALQRLNEASSGGKQLIGSDAGGEFARLLPAYFVGETVWAMGLLAVFAALAVVALCAHSSKRSFFRSLTLISVLHLAAVMLYIGVAGGGVAKITYFSSVWPMFILVLGIGAALGIDVLAGKRRLIRPVLWVLILAGYLTLAIVPVWTIVHLEGKPTPYYGINDWTDKNLPAGTPVLVNRWYEAWNELRDHPSTNVFYTFTVPDEPIENYRRMNWPATAEQFFEKYPKAAYLEINPDKYKKEGEVWSFPLKHFARVSSVTNEQAMILRRFKVFPTGSYGKPNAERVIVRIFYNTPEDLVAAARSKGRDVLRLYGEGWGYAKPGWQRGDFSDYRLFGRSASIDLYNLTDAPLSGTLQISAATAQKPKAVSVGGKSTVFAPGRIKGWNVPLILQPGKNTVPLASPSEAPLFVRDLRWTP